MLTLKTTFARIGNIRRIYRHNGVMFPYVQNLGNDPADAYPVVVGYKPGIFQKVHYGSQGVVQIPFPLVAERNSDYYRNGASECPVPFHDAFYGLHLRSVPGGIFAAMDVHPVSDYSSLTEWVQVSGTLQVRSFLHHLLSRFDSLFRKPHVDGKLDIAVA